MRSNKQQPSKNEEEVDLGSLFQIIGKVFSKILNFIGSIFLEIFNALIVVLLFIKNNILIILITSFLGSVIGFFLESKKDDLYRAQLLVKPNFKSTNLLYTNISFYNDLIEQRDTTSLEKTFAITKEEAASLQRITIEPITVKHDIVDAYNDFLNRADTVTIKNYKYLDFKEAFTQADYKLHKIEVIAKKNNVFKKLENTIISSVENNPYFNRLKSVTYNNITTTDTFIKNSIYQIDSLQKAIKIATTTVPKKGINGTNIDLGDRNKPKEVELLETKRVLIKDLEKLIEDKSEKNKVLNIISSFKPIGSKVKELTKNYIFIFALVGVLLAISVLLLIKVNTYLNTYLNTNKK